MTPDLTAIVVAYRPGKDLRDAIDSVRAQTGTDVEVVVVNNDPADRGPRALGEELGIRVEESGANVGFCAAVNRGLAVSSAPYVLLLNPDARVAPDFAMRLIERMARDASIAAAGGRILRESTDGRFIDSVGIAMGRGRRATDIGHGTLDDGRRSGVDEPFGVTAAAAIYRRSALEAVAVRGEVLPEQFFMYLDDVDLAWRLRLAGFRSIVDHAALAWHRRGAAGDTDGAPTGIRRITTTIARESERPDYVRERSWVNHISMLIRNDDPGPFLDQLPYYALRRAPGDLFGLVQRPAMALRMRIRLLQSIPTTLEERREIQERRVVSVADMARWLP